MRLPETETRPGFSELKFINDGFCPHSLDTIKIIHGGLAFYLKCSQDTVRGHKSDRQIWALTGKTHKDEAYN